MTENNVDIHKTETLAQSHKRYSLHNIFDNITENLTKNTPLLWQLEKKKNLMTNYFLPIITSKG